MHYSGGLQILRFHRDQSSIEHSGDGAVWARVAPEPLARIGTWAGLEGWLAEIAKAGVSRVIFHPGSTDESRMDAEDGEADPIRSAWQLWAPGGQLLMAESVRRLDEACAAASVRPILWPRVHSLVSDIPGLLGVTRRWEQVGILLDPIALFAGYGQNQFADFAGRLHEVIGLPGISALVFAEFQGERAGLKEFAALASAAKSRGVPIVLSHDWADGELERLGFTPPSDRV